MATNSALTFGEKVFSPEVRHCSLTCSTVRDVGPVAKVGVTRERGSSQEEKEERLRKGRLLYSTLFSRGRDFGSEISRDLGIPAEKR